MEDKEIEELNKKKIELCDEIVKNSPNKERQDFLSKKLYDLLTDEQKEKFKSVTEKYNYRELLNIFDEYKYYRQTHEELLNIIDLLIILEPEFLESEKGTTFEFDSYADYSIMVAITNNNHLCWARNYRSGFLREKCEYLKSLEKYDELIDAAKLGLELSPLSYFFAEMLLCAYKAKDDMQSFKKVLDNFYPNIFIPQNLADFLTKKAYFYEKQEKNDMAIACYSMSTFYDDSIGNRKFVEENLSRLLNGNLENRPKMQECAELLMKENVAYEISEDMKKHLEVSLRLNLTNIDVVKSKLDRYISDYSFLIGKFKVDSIICETLTDKYLKRNQEYGFEYKVNKNWREDNSKLDDKTLAYYDILNENDEPTGSYAKLCFCQKLTKDDDILNLYHEQLDKIAQEFNSYTFSQKSRYFNNGINYNKVLIESQIISFNQQTVPDKFLRFYFRLKPNVFGYLETNIKNNNFAYESVVEEVLYSWKYYGHEESDYLKLVSFLNRMVFANSQKNKLSYSTLRELNDLRIPSFEKAKSEIDLYSQDIKSFANSFARTLISPHIQDQKGYWRYEEDVVAFLEGFLICLLNKDESLMFLEKIKKFLTFEGNEKTDPNEEETYKELRELCANAPKEYINKIALVLNSPLETRSFYFKIISTNIDYFYKNF